MCSVQIMSLHKLICKQFKYMQPHLLVRPPVKRSHMSTILNSEAISVLQIVEKLFLCKGMNRGRACKNVASDLGLGGGFRWTLFFLPALATG